MQSEAARDVIARAVEDSSPDPQAHADYLVAELTAAGYRILAPDELDPVTLAATDRWLLPQYGIAPCVTDTDRIRSLIPEAPQPEAKEARDAS